jgi:hypothetical protein
VRSYQFSILLPCAAEKIAEEHEPAESLPTGTACILFADDEDLLVQPGLQNAYIVLIMKLIKLKEIAKTIRKVLENN